MAVIFQYSRRVSAWLSSGTSNILSRKAFQDFATLCDRFDPDDYTEKRKQEEIAQLAKDVNRSVADLLGSVEAILALPYWRRGWILQEIGAVDVPIRLSFKDQTCELADLFALSDVAVASFYLADSRGLCTKTSSWYDTVATGQLFMMFSEMRRVKVTSAVLPREDNTSYNRTVSALERLLCLSPRCRAASSCARSRLQSPQAADLCSPLHETLGSDPATHARAWYRCLCQTAWHTAPPTIDVLSFA